MARFRRRFRSSRRGGSRRKVRWAGQFVSEQNLILDASPDNYSYTSFWVKDPASMARSSAFTAPNTIETNEPVDETLVRLYSHLDATVSIPGTGGIAPVTIISYGIIPFDGGEVPGFWDFAIFSLGSSLVAPPHPMFQVDDPWVLRQDFSNGGLETLQFSSDQYERNEWVRSMRKLPAGLGLLGVLGCVAPSSSGAGSVPVTFNAAWMQRYAVKSGFSV